MGNPFSNNTYLKKKDEDKEIPHKKQPYKKKAIYASMRIMVWNSYFGQNIGNAKCPICLTNIISQLSFECGHIVAERNGGSTDAGNLIPICNICNKSMGTKELHSFKELIHPQSLSVIINNKIVIIDVQSLTEQISKQVDESKLSHIGTKVKLGISKVLITQ